MVGRSLMPSLRPTGSGPPMPPKKSPELPTGPVAPQPPKDDIPAREFEQASRWQTLKTHLSQKLHDKPTMLVAAMVSLVLIGGGVTGALLLHKKPAKPPAQSAKAATIAKPAPKPEPILSPLTGMPVSEANKNRPVTAIMIENSPDARPQSGLRDAGVIYEAIAEGGITRFLTLFQEAQPSYIGPVRSVRPYYLDWLAPFDASVAHVGGSLDALQQVRGGMKDLDQFFNSSAYTRITQRYAPHNVYTSFDKLDALNTGKGYTSSKFTSWPRKPEKAIVPATVNSIDMSISSFYYNVHYTYNAANNNYLRFEAGKSQIDITSQADKTGIQLSPKVVIAIVMPYSYGPADDGYRSSYAVNGSGQAYIFQDGGETTGTWTKADRVSQISFTDAAGTKIPLDPGQTWITVLSAASQLQYKQ
jgi:hypothetical protein